jgi:hypothetical protein
MICTVNHRSYRYVDLYYCISLVAATALAAATAAVREGRHGFQLGRNHLLATFEDLNELSGKAAVLLRNEKAHRKALLSGATRTTNTMDVTFHFLRKVEIHHPEK